jgi:hypothetical protein
MVNGEHAGMHNGKTNGRTNPINGHNRFKDKRLTGSLAPIGVDG